MIESPGLAVLVKGWPRLSETFIAQELAALEASGRTFAIWSLRHPTDRKRHPLHDQVTAAVRYLPEYLHEEPGRLALGLLRMLPRRGFWRALWPFLKDLARDRTRNRLRRFGQACVLAAELPPGTRGLYAHFLHTPSSVARYAAIMRDLPWAFSAHAKDIWTSPDWDLRDKLTPSRHGASFGVTCTAYGATRLRALAGPDGAPVDLVYHGLDLRRFPPPPVRQTRRPGQPLRLLSVGRLVEKKGFDRLLAAFALLPGTLDWHWTHVGGGELGSELRLQADAAGLAARLTWLGAMDQTEVIATLRKADLFVLPSRIAADGDRDGLPNVLMEAASQRVPILATPVAAIPEFIENGVHGTLCEPEPDALALAIQALAADPEGAARMAQAAEERLRQRFAMGPGIAVLASRLDQMLAPPVPQDPPSGDPARPA